LLKDGCCAGAFGWTQSGEPLNIYSGATLMATGGVSQAFKWNLNPPDVSGDGYAIGYNAGAKLINMEFLQIGVGFCHPVVNIFNGYIWEGKPRLYNARGEEFLGKVLPADVTADSIMHEHRRHFPFSASGAEKYLEISLHKEICAGRGTEHDGIFADLTHMTDAYVNSLTDDCGIHHMWPIARDYIKTKGVDLLKQPVEICCFAHAINGGLLIDKNAATTIPGLYAAGETAGGPHGADRLGGNMMVTCQVFGELAGKNAAVWAMKNTMRGVNADVTPEKERVSELLHKTPDCGAMLSLLRKTTQQNLLVNRTAEGLRQVLELVAALQKECAAAPAGKEINLHNFALASMLASVKLIAGAALMRRESRGSHHREDYPWKDDGFGAPGIIEKKEENNE
jgi:L-aspartate oxidase